MPQGRSFTARVLTINGIPPRNPKILKSGSSFAEIDTFLRGKNFKPKKDTVFIHSNIGIIYICTEEILQIDGTIKTVETKVGIF